MVLKVADPCTEHDQDPADSEHSHSRKYTAEILVSRVNCDPPHRCDVMVTTAMPS